MNRISKKIIVHAGTKDLVDKLSSDSIKNVEHYFPIDRFFIEDYDYLAKIEKVDHTQFIFYNLETKSSTYTTQLFSCLPELWEDTEYENILQIMDNFTNSFSFYSLIEFTYKYLEIDLLNEIFLNESINLRFKKDCAEYFPKILATFYMDESDYFDLNNNVYGVDKGHWDAVKIKIHGNNKFKKSLPISQLRIRVREFEKRFCSVSDL